MTIIGIDDTDSRTKGMCTTYVGHRIAKSLEENHDATVKRQLLIRLNPSAKHKTRGNAAVAIHTDANPEIALKVTKEHLDKLPVDDDHTNPGAVISKFDETPKKVQEYTHEAISELLTIEYAESLIHDFEFESLAYGNGRGRIGALAAIGAWEALDDFTYETITYRKEEVRGTEREVNDEILFNLADEFYPRIWDTVDTKVGESVCVPNAPGPILYGIRGDDKAVAETISFLIESEDRESYRTFITNQGTDVHLNKATVSEVEDDKAYIVDAVVSEKPETIKGGHVFFTVECEENPEDYLKVAAFKPTDYFRDYVRDLRVGDKIKICGEVSSGTLKLEKFSVKELNSTKKVNPTCTDCNRSMGSAGANQGYRCRSCGKNQEDKELVTVDRKLDYGWYEVPPCARRHIAKPLVRGGFDGKTNPLR